MLSDKSPGGKDENTGKASAFRDSVTMGAVAVICTDPLKLLRFSRGPMLAAPCALGGRVRLVLPRDKPVAESSAVMVSKAGDGEGFAQAA